MSRVLARALRYAGDPIPIPWELAGNVRPCPGDLIIGLAAPGVGKSMLAVNWAVRLAQGGRPVVMVSTDTSYSDQAARMVSILTGRRTDEVKEDRDRVAHWLEAQELPIRWSELPVPPDDFQDFLSAEEEYLGEFPDLVVVDVAEDMLHGEENVGEIRHIFNELKKAARRSKTVVFALHHVKRGPAASGTKAVTLDDGLYAGEGVAQIVLGLWRLGNNALNVATLKNRNGEASAEGDLFVQLKVDYATASVGGRRR